ncbi:MAG: aspartate aminotransferase family protein [Haloechinothrix sp.]
MAIVVESSPIRRRTDVPGPRSQALFARRERALGRGAINLAPIAVASAHGALVTDEDGNRYIDLAGGIGALAVGHTPDRVTRAIQAQAAELLHMCAIVAPYESYVALAERLNELFPGGRPAKSVLLTTGAEAVENAVSLSRSYTGRQGVVVFEGAFHGRTNLTMTMTSKFNRFKTGFGPFAPEVYRFPFPNVYRRPVSWDEADYVDWHVAELDHWFTAIVEPSHVAAIVVEPIQGEGGFVPAPTRWLQRLRQIADDNGIVLVADEIQSGMGRTGRLWAIEHADVTPDLLTTAKSLGAGMPLSAVVGRPEIIDAPEPGSLGGTYSGNPLSCVAALETLEIITAPGFLERAVEVGANLRQRLEQLQRDHPDIVGPMHGLGPMLAIEITQPDGLSPAPELNARIMAETLRRGVITIRSGLYGSCLRFLPPLTITDEELDEALDVVATVLGTVGGDRP